MKDEGQTSSVPLPPSSLNDRHTAVAPHDCFRALQTPLRFLKGIGPKRAAQLETVGLRTMEDLLYHLPFRYEDRRHLKTISEARIGNEESFVGNLVRLEKRFIPKRRRSILTGILADGSGALGLVWYHVTPYILKGLLVGQRLLIHGKVEGGLGAQKMLVHPEFEVIEPGDEGEQQKILPIYLRAGGIPLSSMRKWAASAMAAYGRFLPGFIPQSVLVRQNLVCLREAMTWIHQPEKDANILSLNRFDSTAHRSIVFDEFFYLQLGLALRRKHRAEQEGVSFSGRNSLTERMRGLLPFTLTAAQERVLDEISAGMESPRPMQRLLQGDVGSGKTMVGWLATLKAIENGYQAVWLAPTELLAEQHFNNLKGFADRLDIVAALLTGSISQKIRRETTAGIEKGEISFVVGTHALIQEEVHVPKMGLGIIDEQHRFGVIQRLALQRLSNCRAVRSPSLPQPDILLMSATPIPRSLAMILYGDMEISWLNEMPPGRAPVRTRLFREKERANVYALVREEIKKGHQAYIVYPLVEASERLELRDATRMFEEFSQGIFRDLSLGLIHGRIASDERDRVMRRFKEGSVQILIATTVIEVGIDVPNATVMVVEHAERFGLSQLHQLRGRVGRGKAASQCLLVYYNLESQEALRRLRVMEKEHDGFRIAEADLALRGPGELLGTRQSGLADFRLANLVRDSRLLLEARQEALAWLKQDPTLTRPESSALREVLRHRWSARLELGGIG
ncbi:MAG TPA: ATP-dependent DNA helicase RecG [Candidatus Binatia bacterium]|nr:ATP-dependent DNA helicase RecG [Candidatus Binatia bacterium]